ncbi:MAG: ImmA/IrrE family metallo-endopeptidase [Bacteroidia bacterium]|jgi:Zn-dependent peptidase ImmA (M78 family)|nr:ImmA/IrrE family metallo-endopeptidase [Bacteroidia bacterium]
MLNKRIERITIQILNEYQIEELPIPVNEIAKKRGLEIKAYDLGEDVSGVLVIKDGAGFIGYNPTESKVRQRFTIAHELGHFELHRDDLESALFIDKQFKVEFRNQDSSTGEMQREREANAFAASILMPEKLLKNEIVNHHFELSDDDNLQELAQLFNVSVSAMTFRLMNLKLLSQF